MFISESSFKNIEYIINNSNTSTLDTYFDIIDLLRSDKVFNNKIKCKYDNKRNSPIYVTVKKDKDILIYNNEIFDSINKKTNILYEKIKNELFLELDKKSIYNYIYYNTLFHELTHLKQFDIGLKQDSNYEVLNKIYKIFLLNKRDNDDYYKNHDKYSYEYNANIMSSSLLLNMNIDETIVLLAKLEYLVLLEVFYSRKVNGTIKYITEDTLDKYSSHINLKKYTDIPIDISVKHGLPLSSFNYDELYNRYVPSMKIELTNTIDSFVKK